jgi:signal transduction histidine kinase
MGHRVQLEVVIANLVRNAIQVMNTVEPIRRALKVRTKFDGAKAVTLEVEDSGLGIDIEFLDSIFDAFVTTKVDGMGLGLAICRTIIEHHGGKITASSDGKSGALFQVILPIDLPD